jgi:cytochrome c oxidase subunit 4
MARDDDTDDKKSSEKRRAGEAKPSAAKAKENGGAAGKASEPKKNAELGAEKAASDKPKEKTGDKAVKKAKEGKEGKEGKVRAADVPAKAAREAPAAHAHAALPHGHHAPDRKEYWKIFVVLFVLTVIEVGVAQVPGISKTLLVIALVGLAIAKAACVAFFYMHLKHETRVLRAYVAIPFAAPAVYALVLIAEAAWRLTR